MFQQFYKDTLGGRYIKSLLSQTPIPVFDAVVDGDHVIAGCYYVYRRFIIQCHTTGILLVNANDSLYPSDQLFPSNFLFPKIGFRAATFYVRSIVDTYNPKTHATFTSTTNYYDAETHYHLGRYLRYTLTTTGLNLFPYYNCYNGTRFSDVSLSKSKQIVTVKRTAVQTKKVIAVPILFGHTYTIAISCPTEVLLRPVIYDDSGYVDTEKLPQKLVDLMDSSGYIYNRLSFSNPIQFTIETDSIECQMFQKNLYLAIQLPINNDSSIVALENYDLKRGVRCEDENGVRSYNILNPSLLAMNTKRSYAFSDRLLEYLVGNVIYKFDPISYNIATAQKLLGRWSSDYKDSFIQRENEYGVWDNNVCQLVSAIAESYGVNHNVYDQDGNLNKDIISILEGEGEL